MIKAIDFLQESLYNIYNKSANISKSFKAKEDKMNGYIIKATCLTDPYKKDKSG